MDIMKVLTLYKDDIAAGSMLSWNGLLEDLGVETHVLVGGRIIDKEIDHVDISVYGNSIVCHDESGEVIR